MSYGANIFATGMDAFDNAYARGQAFRQDRAKTQAGRALAQGDRQGAAQSFGQAGMTDDVRQMQADDARQAEAEYQHGQDAQQQDLATQQRRAAALKNAAMGLKGVQPGHRAQVLQQIAGSPLFQQAGIDPAMFQGLTEEQLTDQALDAFTGEVDNHLKVIQLGSGGVAQHDERTGEFKILREPDKPVIVGNGATALDPVTHQPIYRNPKTFAPPRAGGGGIPAPPAGWSPVGQ